MIVRLAGIQALRGVAAMAVVVHHGLEMAEAPASVTLIGASGVDIFFVISGFVMGYASGGLSAGEFLLRRLVRIAPLYGLSTLAIVALAMSGLAYRSLDVSPIEIVRSLLFIDGLPVLRMGWTLNYEMYFYLLFAGVIAAGLLRWAAWVIPPVLALVVVAGVPYLGKSIILEFGFGVMLAAALARGLSGRWAWPAALAAAALVIAASLFWPDSPTGGLRDDVRWFAWGAPAVLAVYAALWWTPRWTLIGDASYSIYLVHGLVMAGLAKVLASGALTAWVAVPASILVSLALGVGVYLAIEGPLHRRTSAWFKARKARREAAGATA